MKKVIIYVIAIFCFGSTQAEELTLFDVVLRSATRQDISIAVNRVGGRLSSKSSDIDTFDIKAIGLPSVNSLEIVYLEDKVVFAQYQIGGYGADNERFRKMLVNKYGQPNGGRSSFDGQYLSDGTYSWNFDGNMALVYKKPFTGSTTLTYVNRTEQSRLESLVNEKDKQEVKRAADTKKNLF